MPITASSAQLAAQPVQNTPTSAAVTTTGVLVAGASIGPVDPKPTATADEVMFFIEKSGTLTGDCTVEVQISPNGVNWGAARVFTNAEFNKTTGCAGAVKVGVGNFFRVQFIAGTTASPNGVNVRYKN